MEDYKVSLKAARVNSGMKQSDVAQALKISTKTLCNWESERTYPTLDMLVRLCALYKIPLGKIILPKT
jgi:DNA-binding XRE family transcriptional regulator